MNFYPLYEVSSPGHVLRDREAWKTEFEERDLGGTDLPREISRDTKLGVGVAVHPYTRIIDVVNHCFGMAEPSKYGITYQS